MRINVMRSIDSLVGEPACRILGKLRGAQSRPTETPKSILIQKCMGMGSLLLLTPTLGAIRREYPNARISLLTFQENESLAKHLAGIDEVKTIDSSSPLNFLRDVSRHLFDFRKTPPDLSFDFEFFSRFTALFATLAGSRYRIGFYSKTIQRGSLLDLPVPYVEDDHIEEIFFRLARAIGIESKSDRQKLASTPKMRDGVIINANTSPLALERRWMPERFAEIARRLGVRNERVIFIGSADERDHVEKIRFAAGSGENLAGTLTMDELIDRLSGAKLLISNDSGPAHIAAATGTPVLTLFGPETPARYAPVGSASRTIYHPVWCSPCMSVYNAKKPICNGNNVCMQKIEIDEVWKQIEEMLGG